MLLHKPEGQIYIHRETREHDIRVKGKHEIKGTYSSKVSTHNMDECGTDHE